MLQNKLHNRFFKSFTVSESGLIISSYAEDYRVRGYQFIHLNPDVLANGTSYFVLDPTAINAAEKSIFTIPIKIDVPEGPITITVYEGTDYVGTVALPYYNPNRIDGATAQATIKGVASGATKGTQLYQFRAGASSLPATVSAQGSVESADPTAIDSTKKYLVQVDNPTGSDITANLVYFAWYEVPNEFL